MGQFVLSPQSLSKSQIPKLSSVPIAALEPTGWILTASIALAHLVFRMVIKRGYFFSSVPDVSRLSSSRSPFSNPTNTLVPEGFTSRAFTLSVSEKRQSNFSLFSDLQREMVEL